MDISNAHPCTHQWINARAHRNTGTVEDRAGTAKYLHLLMHACPCHSFGWLSFTQQVLNTCYPLWLLVFFAGESDSEAQALWRTFALEWTVLTHTKELLPWLLPKAFPSSSGWTSESWMRFCFYPLLCHSCCILPLAGFAQFWTVFCLFVCFSKGNRMQLYCLLCRRRALEFVLNLHTFVTLHSSFLSRYFSRFLWQLINRYQLHSI